MIRLRNHTFVRPRPLPALITLGACALLLSLGIWQLQRLHWKQGVIARLEQAKASLKYAPLTDIPPADIESHEFEKIQFRAKPDCGKKPFHVMTQQSHGLERTLGYQVALPLIMEPSGTHILYNMGWIPADQKPLYNAICSGQKSLPATVYMGVVRLFAHAPLMGIRNQPEKNLWLWYDRKEMETALGAPLFPAIVAREGNARMIKENRLVYPVGFSLDDVHPRNDHLQYAFIWFSLALACFVIFVTYHLKRKS